MTSSKWMHNAALGLGAIALICFATQFTQAQSANFNSGTSVAAGSASESSSTAGLNDEVAGLANGDTLANYLRTEAVGEGVAANGGSSGGGRRYSSANTGRLALEFGGGFNAPIGNDTPYITWGGNLTIGAGLHLNQYLSVLGEYQFMDNKLPGMYIYESTGTNAYGNAYINSLTVSPMLDLFPRRINSVYATGGFGWYHKKTEFSQVVGYDYFGNPIEVTLNEFSSDQLGGSFGLGYSHRLGGVYGDGRAKLFAEARYLFINSPSASASAPLYTGTTSLIPVTFGIRW